MKKILCLCVIFALTVILSACGTQKKSNSEEVVIEDTDTISEINGQNETGVESPVSNASSQTNQTPAQCSHTWTPATCQAPMTCTKCGATQGSVGSCKDNGNGICAYCGKDLFLENVKAGLTMQLIVPSAGASDNYYFKVNVVNHTGSTIYLSCFASANGKLCDNYDAKDYALDNDYSIAVPYYNNSIEYKSATNRWSDYKAKYATMYLDNSSVGNTTVKINGKTVHVKYGTSGIIKVGYSLQDIDVY